VNIGAPTHSIADSPLRLRFDVFTLFPPLFESPLASSILKRALDLGIVEVALHDPRGWTTDRHRTADDTPYGGGPGMVLKAPPIVEAVESVLGTQIHATRCILLSAAGAPFTQSMASELAESTQIALICGHYEGVDERVREILNCEEVSIGDYVMTGGELPALVIIDAVTRLLPGVIERESIADESHASGLLEYPHYTRPFEYRGHTVPDILLGGHHARIAAWRREQAMLKTRRLRPDLLSTVSDPDAE